MEQNYFDEYISEKQVRLLSELTIKSYVERISYFYKMFPDKSCSDITITEIKEFILKYAPVWNRKTLSWTLIIIKNHFKWLYNKGYIKQNPMDNVKPPTAAEDPIEFVSQKELDQLDEVADDVDTPLLSRVLYWLIKETGLRSGEIKMITKDGLNLTERLLYLKNTKGKVTKLVAFSTKTEKLLRQWIIERPSDTEHVFVGIKGKPLQRERVYEAINYVFGQAFGHRWKKKSGGHMLRHVAATQWIARGGNLEGLRWMMGWRNFKQVERYVHQSPTMIKQMFKEVNGKKNKKI